MAAFVLIVILCTPLLIWGIAAPRSMWEVLHSWQYKNPEKNEPSEASFALTRVTSVFALVFLVAMIPVLNGILNDTEEQREREQYEDCLDEHDDDEGLLSPEDWCDDLDPDDPDND